MQPNRAEYADLYRLYRNFYIYADADMVQISGKILNDLEGEIMADGFDLAEIKHLAGAPS